MIKHSKYFRILPNQFYETASKTELEAEFRRLKHKVEEGHDRAYLKKLHRTRTFACWHDTSCISNASHFLVLVNCVYDEALFYTNDEYAAKTGKFIYRNQFYFFFIINVISCILNFKLFKDK